MKAKQLMAGKIKKSISRTFRKRKIEPKKIMTILPKKAEFDLKKQTVTFTL